jgi:hypothetical protein
LRARAQGAALVAAHPYSPPTRRQASGELQPFATDPGRWAALVDRFELFNRDTVFPWVAEAGLPAVATGDFHVLDHFATWKTMLPCPRDELAVVDYLRSGPPAYMVRVGRAAGSLDRAA